MAGVSLVELMIAMLLGLIILAGLATIFANSSRAREELERSSRQIENGRYAMETLSDDLRMAGFYGELNVSPLAAPAVLPPALPDPCSTDPAVWAIAIPIHVQGYDNGNGIPACVPASRKADTDVVVIRRAAACEAGVAGCPPTQNSLPFVQVSKCLVVPPEPNFVIGSWGTAAFTVHMRNCTAVAGVRQYYVRIYYISTNNGQGVAIPTLTRLDFTGTGWVMTPLVEGIEEMNIEYGIDWRGVLVTDPPDGAPDAYTTDPTNFTAPGCVLCANPAYNWSNVVTARINILARNIDTTPNYVDGKTYSMGRDAAGAEITVTPGGPFRRHAYTGMVRIVNAAERRDVP
jgi:type IV pilus assembly protein PilW